MNISDKKLKLIKKQCIFCGKQKIYPNFTLVQLISFPVKKPYDPSVFNCADIILGTGDLMIGNYPPGVKAV